MIDIDLRSLKIILQVLFGHVTSNTFDSPHKYDGTAREPKYILAVFSGPDPTAIVKNPKIYTGSCHCGAVMISMKTKEWLHDGNEYIQEYDCSICACDVQGMAYLKIRGMVGKTGR